MFVPKRGELVNYKGIKGIVRFVGATQFASGEWVGVELVEPTGKNDGTVGEVSYFRCAPKRGIFVKKEFLKAWDLNLGRKGCLSPKPKEGIPGKKKKKSTDQKENVDNNVPKRREQLFPISKKKAAETKKKVVGISKKPETANHPLRQVTGKGIPSIVTQKNVNLLVNKTTKAEISKQTPIVISSPIDSETNSESTIPFIVTKKGDSSEKEVRNTTDNVILPEVQLPERKKESPICYREIGIQVIEDSRPMIEELDMLKKLLEQREEEQTVLIQQKEQLKQQLEEFQSKDIEEATAQDEEEKQHEDLCCNEKEAVKMLNDLAEEENQLHIAQKRELETKLAVLEEKLESLVEQHTSEKNLLECKVEQLVDQNTQLYQKNQILMSENQRLRNFDYDINSLVDQLEMTHLRLSQEPSPRKLQIEELVTFQKPKQSKPVQKKKTRKIKQ